jgi:hypothetical protein
MFHSTRVSSRQRTTPRHLSCQKHTGGEGLFSVREEGRLPPGRQPPPAPTSAGSATCRSSSERQLNRPTSIVPGAVCSTTSWPCLQSWSSRPHLCRAARLRRRLVVQPSLTARRHHSLASCMVPPGAPGPTQQARSSPVSKPPSHLAAGHGVHESGRLCGAQGGASELKQHAWFKGFDWELLAQRKMRAPYLPKVTQL